MVMSLLEVLPDMPIQVTNVIDSFFDIIFQGATLVNLFIDINYVGVLFGIYLALVLFINGYKIVMWVLNKVPMIDID